MPNIKSSKIIVQFIIEFTVLAWKGTSIIIFILNSIYQINNTSWIPFWNLRRRQSHLMLCKHFWLDTVQDLLIKLGIKPCLHILKISILSLNNVIFRPTKINNIFHRRLCQARMFHASPSRQGGEMYHPTAICTEVLTWGLTYSWLFTPHWR